MQNGLKLNWMNCKLQKAFQAETGRCLNEDIEHSSEKCRCRIKLSMAIGIDGTVWIICLKIHHLSKIPNYLFTDCSQGAMQRLSIHTTYWWSAVSVFIWLTDGGCTSHSSPYTYWQCQTRNQYIKKSSMCEAGKPLWFNANTVLMSSCCSSVFLKYLKPQQFSIY